MYSFPVIIKKIEKETLTELAFTILHATSLWTLAFMLEPPYPHLTFISFLSTTPKQVLFVLFPVYGIFFLRPLYLLNSCCCC